MKIYTIGFTGKTAEEFFRLLNSTDAKYLVDTRLNNTSQLAGFTKKRDLEYFTAKLTDMSYLEMPMLAPEKDMFTEYRKGGNWELYESLYVRLLEERAVVEKIGLQNGSGFLVTSVANRIIRQPWPQEIRMFAEGVVLLCSERTAEKCHRRLAAEHLQQYAFPESDVTHL